MTSYQLIVVSISALGVVATFIKLFSDTRHLNDKLSSLSEKAGNPKGDLSQEHEAIQKAVDSSKAQLQLDLKPVSDFVIRQEERQKVLAEQSFTVQESSDALQKVNELLLTEFPKLYGEIGQLRAENKELLEKVDALENQMISEGITPEYLKTRGPQLTKKMAPPF